MGMGLLVKAPSRRLRILWADDDLKYLQAEHHYLKAQGHVLACTTDFESTASRLASEKFDLLILDQQLPREGRKDIYAGTGLAEMLCAGELGDLNRNVHFLFWTASEAWVEDSGFDVQECLSCLGIEEKGGYLFDALGEYVDKVISLLPAFDSADEGVEAEWAVAEGTASASEAPAGEPVLDEEWTGVVLDVGSGTFHSRLSSVGDPLPDHEATLPLELVSGAEQELIEEGATFRWAMAIEERGSGERVATSWVRFDEVPEISQEDVDEAFRLAREKRERREGAHG
jgi:CheY-like chemotaxis protein